MSTSPSSFQVGQTVAVKELAFGVQVTAADSGEPGLTVREVDAEHLLLEDPSGSLLHIPAYLISKTVQPPLEINPAA